MTVAERAWAYRAVDANGKRVQGHAEAADPRQLAQALETKGLILVTADPDEADTGGPATPGLGRHQILEVTRALAALLPAGLLLPGPCVPRGIWRPVGSPRPSRASGAG